MGAPERSTATLRLFGDDLVPEEVSARLGVPPTESWSRGQELVGASTGRVRIAKTGAWLLQVDGRQPVDLDARVTALLGRLASDPAVWKVLARYRPELFCGLFMGSGNDGLTLSARVLLALGEHGQ